MYAIRSYYANEVDGRIIKYLTNLIKVEGELTSNEVIEALEELKLSPSEIEEVCKLFKNNDINSLDEMVNLEDSEDTNCVKYRITSYNVCYTKLLRSGVYEKAIKDIDKGITTFSKACPLFVNLVEEGWWDNEIVITSYSIHYTKLYERPRTSSIMLYLYFL